MNKPQAPPAPTHATSSLSVFLTNVHLLDLDRSEDWPAISAQTFTSKNTLQNEKNRIHCVEWAFYRLFEIWDPGETQDKLQPFFPPLEPLQSLNLRAALFRCLNDLKKNGDLGKETIMRKSMFDDCKGEKLQELLASFSTIVLRKILAAGDAGRVSIAGRLAIANRVTVKEHDSLLPLAIAHRASLTGLLRKKRELRARYQSFGCTLAAKEKELDQRFEGVVQTQAFLDENEIPDNTVSRLSMLFEKHWQGDPDLIAVVTQGEEHGLRDSLLDRPFHDVWPEVSNGNFGGKGDTNRQGLLQDLEKRVADQESRLNQWKDFKEAITRGSTPKVVPKAQDLSLTRSTSNEQENHKRRERDLVFSPRKSPRKSDWELKELISEDSPTPAMPKMPNFGIKSSTSASRPLGVARKAGAQDQSPEGQRRDSLDRASPSEPSCNGSHDSSFSEVSGVQLHEIASPDRFTDTDATFRGRVEGHKDDSPSTPPNEPAILSTGKVISGISDDRNSKTTIPDDDDILAEQIISMTLNAAPTPAKPEPKRSLSERTRQSIAFASPSKFQGLQSDESPPPRLPIASTNEQIPQTGNTAAKTTSLLERTRQSISLVPSNTNPTAKSHTRKPSTTHHRRSSSMKIYPTNPFETPRKQMSKKMGKGLTPPEELFTPGAGYESVFKSRPKVAVSPVGTPEPEVGMDEEGEGLGR